MLYFQRGHFLLEGFNKSSFQSVGLPDVAPVLQYQELLGVLPQAHIVLDVGVFVDLVGVQEELPVAECTAVPHDELDHVPHVAVPVLVLLDAHLVERLTVPSHGRQSVCLVTKPTPVFAAVLHVVAEYLGPGEFPLVMRGLSPELGRCRHFELRPGSIQTLHVQALYQVLDVF